LQKSALEPSLVHGGGGRSQRQQQQHRSSAAGPNNPLAQSLGAAQEELLMASLERLDQQLLQRKQSMPTTAAHKQHTNMQTQAQPHGRTAARR
jgi:hypothetical protein